MIRVYPFASGSLYTASYALAANYAISASLIDYVPTASVAGVGAGPTGQAASINICLITYNEYQTLISNTSVQEQCLYPTN